MNVLIDSGYLNVLCSPGLNPDFEAWLRDRQSEHPDLLVVIPEIVDYEVRRGFLWRMKHHAKEGDRANHRRVAGFLERLDSLSSARQVRLLPTTKEVLERAAELWAEARSGGYPTAAEDRIDIDVIVASHAVGENAEVATTDRRDYRRYGLKVAETTSR